MDCSEAVFLSNSISIKEQKKKKNLKGKSHIKLKVLGQVLILQFFISSIRIESGELKNFNNVSFNQQKQRFTVIGNESVVAQNGAHFSHWECGARRRQAAGAYAFAKVS